MLIEANQTARVTLSPPTFFHLPSDVITLVINHLKDLERIPLTMVNKRLHQLTERTITSLNRKGLVLKAFDHAAAFGTVELVNWYQQVLLCQPLKSALESTASKGNLAMLIHFKTQEAESIDQLKKQKEFDWNRVCSATARSGHLEVLKWARANGCPWNENTCAFAAGNGHLEVLKWARSKWL